MAGRQQNIQSNQSAVNYVNKKGINELFEVEFPEEIQKGNIVASSGDDDWTDGS